MNIVGDSRNIVYDSKNKCERISDENEYKEWREYMIKKTSIGKGMYSKVYYGYNKNTKKEIALKKILFNSLQNKVKDRVITEINILQKLSHKHVIKLYDHKFDGEYILLIIEYCNGNSLKEWMKNTHSEEEICNVIRQILLGIHYLHENGIMHRDIKPENIMFSESEIKICDFGFSSIIKEQNELFNTMCGTPLYMSPEILFLQPYDIKSEIWSLGILLYSIIFKKHPFGNLENIEQYRHKIKEKYTITYDNGKGEYKDEFIFKTIPIIKDMLEYKSDLRPSLENIIERLDIGTIINRSGFIRSNNIILYESIEKDSNSIFDNDRIVSPFGSYNSPFLGPYNSPSSPFIKNPYNTPYRKLSDLEVGIYEKYENRIAELEVKINKLENTINSCDMDKSGSETVSTFELDEQYFKELYDNKEKSKSIFITKKNISNNSSDTLVGTIYNFITKSL